MSRSTERVVVGVLGLVGAVLGLVIGVRLLTGGGVVDVTASSDGGAEVTVPAVPDGEAESEVGDASDSLVVSTTAGSATTTVSPTTATTAVVATASTTTSVVSTASTSTSTSIVDNSTESSTETTIPSDDGDSDTTATSTTSASTRDTVLPPSTSATPEISDIERAIIRLTNELRTNPAGPQRRQRPMPECVVDSEIEIDAETGHPTPVRRLTPSQPVSIQMARDWSQKMADADTMTHRSAGSQDAIYAELGIDWAARGENVAWAVGYDLSEVAQLFFRGWRESDGHYCNMMSGAFTEIGVGHVRTDGGKDFATQNFYRPR